MRFVLLRAARKIVSRRYTLLSWWLCHNALANHTAQWWQVSQCHLLLRTSNKQMLLMQKSRVHNGQTRYNPHTADKEDTMRRNSADISWSDSNNWYARATFRRWAAPLTLVFLMLLGRRRSGCCPIAVGSVTITRDQSLLTCCVTGNTVRNAKVTQAATRGTIASHTGVGSQAGVNVCLCVCVCVCADVTWLWASKWENLTGEETQHFSSNRQNLRYMAQSWHQMRHKNCIELCNSLPRTRPRMT